MAYEYVKDEYGDEQVCECCESIAPVEIFGGNSFEADAWLCEICSTTIIGRLRLNPDQQFKTLMVVAQVANVMLDILSDRKSRP